MRVIPSNTTKVRNPTAREEFRREEQRLDRAAPKKAKVVEKKSYYEKQLDRLNVGRGY